MKQQKIAPIRIQKFLADSGLGSRRKIDELLQQGRIKINGIVATPGTRMLPTDRISIDGHLQKLQTVRKKNTRVLIFHKPEHVICTRHDPENRPTIFDFLPHISHSRWITVGRLDVNTAGLLLLTTDGELANRLMHPSNQIEREYAVRIIGELNPEIIQRFLSGIMLEDGIAKFKHIIDAGGRGMNHWYHVTITEGRQREVRRIFEAVHVKINRLIRVRFGNVVLPSDLRKGKFRELSADEVKTLFF
jgi:23S rRNA pseudouridine2605 synthase